jgi:hypothetical protein
MKQEFDKEMDSLLRRSARLAAGPQSAFAARAPAASSHLDADELSAFAENALPSAARFAAASHLADCDECRSTVVRLAGAADTAGEIEKRAAAAPYVPVAIPWWKSLLGAAFTPRMLRYAAPVLVLGLVGVVSLIALRTRQGMAPATVYQKAENADTGAAGSPGADTATTGAAPAADANTAPTSAGTGGLTSPTATKADSTSVAQPAAPVVSDKDAVSLDGPAPRAAEKSAGQDASGTGGPARETSEAVSVTSNTVTTPAPAPPPAKAAPAEVAAEPKAEPKKAARDEELARAKAPDDSYTYNDRVQQTEQQNRAANQARNRQEMQMPDGGAQRGESRAMNNSSRGNVGGESASRAQRSAPAGRRGRADEDSKKKERASAAEADEAVRVETETRSVGGRRFRREGNAWVDDDYKPSMKMTGVRRGTDQYRALVADIPELGRIAERLGGEVIAVVKGRAYRIR